MAPKNQAPVEMVVAVPRKPTHDELGHDLQRRRNLREAEREKTAATWLRATRGERQFGRGRIGAQSLKQKAAAELTFLRAAETAAAAHRTKACKLSSVIRVTNEGRGAANSVTLEAFEVDPDGVGLTLIDASVTAIRDGVPEFAPVQQRQLLEGQTWETKLTLELADGFDGGVIKIRFALVCVELPRTVIEHALRVKVVELPPSFTG